MQDAAARAAARHELQLDAEFPGPPAHRRRRQRLLAGRAASRAAAPELRGGWEQAAASTGFGSGSWCAVHGAAWRAVALRAAGASVTAAVAATARRRGAPSRCPRLRLRAAPARSRPAAPRRPCRRARRPCRRPATAFRRSPCRSSRRPASWSSPITRRACTCQATISASAMPSPMSGTLMTSMPIRLRISASTRGA